MQIVQIDRDVVKQQDSFHSCSLRTPPSLREESFPKAPWASLGVDFLRLVSRLTNESILCECVCMYECVYVCVYAALDCQSLPAKSELLVFVITEEQRPK